MRVPVEIPEALWGKSRWRGRIVDIHVEKGQRVKAGDPLIEVEIDKAVVVVESPYDGVIVDVLVAPGDEIGPGDVVVVMEVGSRDTVEAAGPA